MKPQTSCFGNPKQIQKSFSSPQFYEDFAFLSSFCWLFRLSSLDHLYLFVNFHHFPINISPLKTRSASRVGRGTLRRLAEDFHLLTNPGHPLLLDGTSIPNLSHGHGGHGHEVYNMSQTWYGYNIWYGYSMIQHLKEYENNIWKTAWQTQ